MNRTETCTSVWDAIADTPEAGCAPANARRIDAADRGVCETAGLDPGGGGEPLLFLVVRRQGACQKQANGVEKHLTPRYN